MENNIEMSSINKSRIQEQLVDSNIEQMAPQQISVMQPPQRQSVFPDFLIQKKEVEMTQMKNTWKQILKKKNQENFKQLMEKTDNLDQDQNYILKHQDFEDIKQFDSKNLEKNLMKQLSSIEFVFRKRKLARFFCHFLIFLVLFLIFFIYWLYHDRNKVFNIPKLKTYDPKNKPNLNLVVANCLVNFRNENLTDPNLDIQIKITFTAGLLQKGKLLNGTDSFYQVEDPSNNISYTFVIASSFDEIRYCTADVYFSSAIQDLGFYLISYNCQEDQTCYLVQNNTLLQSTILNMRSSGEKGSLSVNFGNLQVDSKLNFLSENQGAVYIQNMDMPNGGNGLTASFDMLYGTFIFQSTDEFILDWISKQQSFCLYAPYFNPIHKNEWNCDLEDGSEFHSETNGDGLCNGNMYFCTEALGAGCVPNNLISVEIESGSIYANLLPSKYSQPDSGAGTYRLASLDFKSKEIEFEANFKEQIGIKLNETHFDPMFRINIGQRYLQTMDTTYWTFSENQGFAITKPWNLAAMTAGLLSNENIPIEGFLAPGFCPYVTSYTIADYKQIWDLLRITLDENQVGSTSFILPRTRTLPPLIYIDSDGMDMFYPEGDPKESWYELFILNGEPAYRSLDMSNNPLIIATFIMSCVCSLIVAIGCLIMSHWQINAFNQYLVNVCQHFEKYAKLVVYEDKRKKQLEMEQFLTDSENVHDEVEEEIQANIQGQSTRLVQKSIPKILHMIDYYSYVLVKQYMIDSVKAFYHMLFRERTQDEKVLMQRGEMVVDEYLEIKERDLKELYEKFCFMNHFTEKTLSEPKYIDHLKMEYGYIFCVDDNQSQVYNKIAEKKFQQLPTEQDIVRVDSVVILFFLVNLILFSQIKKLFIQCCYNVTGIETDQEWVEDLISKYRKFCKRYRIVEKEIRPQSIADMLSIRIVYKQSMKMQRIKDIDLNDEESGDKKSKHEKIYFIDVNQMNMHFNLQADPAQVDSFFKLLSLTFYIFKSSYMITKPVSKQIYNYKINYSQIFLQKNFNSTNADDQDDFKIVFTKTMYYKNWYLTDFLVVVQFYLFYGILLLPIWFVILILTTNQSPYSLATPQLQLTGKDLAGNFLNLPAYVFELDRTSMIIFLIVFAYFVLVHLIRMYNYKNAKFPEDKAFIHNQQDPKTIKMKAFYYFELGMIYILLMVVSFYIAMILFWLLLGAIINPNRFLVYSSAAATLITTVSAKIKNAQEANKNGEQKIRQIIMDILSKSTKGMAQRLISEALTEDEEQNQSGGSGKSEQLVNFDESGAMQREVQKFQQKLELFYQDPGKQIHGQSVDGAEAKKVDQKDIQVYVTDLKEEFIKRARQTLDEKCQELNIPQQLYSILDKVLFDMGEKSISVERAINSIVQDSESGILNEKIVHWIIAIASESNWKNMKSGDLRQTIIILKDQLIDGLLDIIIPSQFLTEQQAKLLKAHDQQRKLQEMINLQKGGGAAGGAPDAKQQPQQQVVDIAAKKEGEAEFELIQQRIEKIKLIIQKILVFIRTLERSDQAALIKIIIDIILILPKDNVWAQDNNAIFMIKCLNLLLQLTTGQTNTNVLQQSCLETLEVLNIPEKLGMFLSLILSPVSANSWQFGMLKIVKDKQLNKFIKQFIKELNYTGDAASNFTFFFTSIFQIIRGKQINPKKLFSKILPRKAPNLSKTTHKMLGNAISLQHTVSIAGENYYILTKKLASNTGIQLEFVQQMSALGTNLVYCFSSPNRIELLENSTLMNIIASDMRINQNILMGLIVLYHREKGARAKYYLEALVNELASSLHIEIEVTKKIFLSFLLLINCTSPLEAESILLPLINIEDKRTRQLKEGLIRAFCDLEDERYKKKKKKDRTDISEITDKAKKEIVEFMIKPYYFLHEKDLSEQGNGEIKVNPTIVRMLKKKFINKNVKLLDNPSANKIYPQELQLDAIAEEDEEEGKLKQKSSITASDHKLINNKNENFTEIDHIGEEKFPFIEKQAGTEPSDQSQYSSVNNKPIYMFDQLFNELSRIFICPEVGIKLTNEAQYIIVTIINFLKLKYMDESSGKGETQGKIEYKKKQVCSSLAKVFNLSITSFTHFYNLLEIGPDSQEALIYFIQNQKEFKIFSNSNFQKEDKIVQSSSKQVIEFLSLQNSIVNKTAFNKMQNFIPAFLFKYKKLLMDLMFRTQISLNPDNMACLLSDIVDEVNKNELISKNDQNLKYIKEIQEALFSLIYFKDVDLNDLLWLIINEANLNADQQRALQQLKNNQLLRNTITQVKQFIYALLQGNSLDAAKVICNILNKKYGHQLTSVVMTSMIYNKTLGMIDDGTSDSKEEDDNRQSRKVEDYMKDFKSFALFFPYIEYYFTSDPQVYSSFALYILRQKFDYQSLNEQQVSALFSLFGPNPKFQAISQLLKTSSYCVEIPHLIAQLIFNNNKDSVIEELTKSYNLQFFSQRMKFVSKEVLILLKLFYNCMSHEDLDELFEVYNLKDQFDNGFVKGLYSFVAPEYLPRDWNKIGLATFYQSGYELRKQVFLKIHPNEKDKKFSAIDLIYNIKRGYFMNISIMRDNIPIIRESNFFGGKLLLRDIFTGIFGFFKNIKDQSENDITYLLNKIQDIFQEIELKKQLKNDWITSFYLINVNLKINPKAFLNYALQELKFSNQQAQKIAIEKQSLLLGLQQTDEEILQQLFPYDPDSLKKNDDAKSLKSGKSKRSKQGLAAESPKVKKQATRSARRKSTLVKLDQEEEEDIDVEEGEMSILQKFNKLSILMKYNLLEYEYQKNIHKASKIESTNEEEANKITFKSAFAKVDIKQYEQQHVFNNIYEATGKNTSIDNQIIPGKTHTIKSLYVLIARRFAELKIGLQEKRFIIFYMIANTSLKNLQVLEKQRQELIANLKQDNDEREQTRIPLRQSILIVKMFMEMDLLFTAIDRWGQFTYSEDFSAFNKNVLEELLMVGLFAENFQKFNQEEEKAQQAQQAQQPQQQQQQQQTPSPDNQQQQFLDWNFSKIFNNSLQQIFDKVSGGKGGKAGSANYNKIVVQTGLKHYNALNELIKQWDQTQSIQSDPSLKSQIQQKIQTIFSPKIEESFKFFNSTDPQKADVDNEPKNKTDKRRLKLLNLMKSVNKHFIYLFNTKTEQIDKALQVLSSKRPGILGNTNSIQFIRNLLGSTLPNTDTHNTYEQEIKPLINYLCTTMQSDVYNIKLFMKVMFAQSANLQDYQEMIKIIMHEKEDMFTVILLIYGKTMKEQYGHPKVHKLFNYDKFPVDIEESNLNQYDQMNKKEKKLKNKALLKQKEKNKKLAMKSMEEYEAHFIQKLTEKKTQHSQRLKALILGLRNLLLNASFDKEMKSYIITLIMCLCGETEQWMILLNKKLNICEKKKNLIQFLYKLFFKFKQTQMVRNLDYEAIRTSSIYDIMSASNNFKMDSILKLTLNQGKDEKNQKKQNQDNKQFMHTINVIIDVFSCMSKKIKQGFAVEINKNDYMTLAEFLVQQQDYDGSKSLETNVLFSQIQKTIKYVLRLSFLMFINSEQKILRNEVLDTVQKFRKIVEIKTDQYKEINKISAELFNFTGKLMAGLNIGIFENLLKLQIFDQSKIYEFASIWCWSKVPYAIKQDQGASVNDELSLFMMHAIQSEIEPFKFLQSQEASPYASARNSLGIPPKEGFLKLIRDSINDLFIQPEKNMQQSNLMDININQETEEQIKQRELKSIKNEIHKLKKDLKESNKNQKQMKAKLAELYLQQDSLQSTDILRKIYESLKIHDTPACRIGNSFMTNESFFFIGKCLSKLLNGNIEDVMGNDEKLAYKALLEEIDKIVHIFDSLGPKLKNMLFGYVKFLLNCSGMFDTKILKSFMKFAKFQIMDKYPELSQKIVGLIQEIESMQINDFAQIIGVELLSNQQGGKKGSVPNLADQQQGKQAGAGNISLKTCLEILMPLLFMGYNILSTRKHQDTIVFEDQSKKTIQQFSKGLQQFSQTISSLDQNLKQCVMLLFELIIRIIQGQDKDELINLKQKDNQDNKGSNPVIQVMDSYFQYLGVNQQQMQDKIKKQMRRLEDITIKVEQFFFNLSISGNDSANITTEVVGIISDFMSREADFNQGKLSYIKKIIESIINLAKQDFMLLQEEFFITFKVSSADAQKIKTIMNQYKILVNQALTNMKTQEQLFWKKNQSKNNKSRLNNIMQKLEKDIPLSNEDLYFLADINNTGNVSLNEFRILLKRLGIVLSQHRVIEIFANVKEPTFTKTLTRKTPTMDLLLKKEEFEKGLSYVQNKSIGYAMQNQGFSIEQLAGQIVYMVIFLILLLIFIFLGVEAFTKPSSFGSMINSLFPVAGGISANKQAHTNVDQSKDNEKLTEVSKDSLETIQANKI